MWFKTRTGMVCIEGSMELLADRWGHSGALGSAGVFAYQMGYPDVHQKRFLRASLHVTNRKVYLACFPDDGSAEGEVAKCMQRIEAAIREGDPICDLSDLGTAGAWGRAPYSIMVKWPGRPDLANG